MEQDGRLPPAYFVPSQLGKDAILKDEKVFFIIFSNFSNVQSFMGFFCQINLIMRGLKRHFQGILLYETCSTANLLPLAIFKKFFFETFFYRNFLSKTLVFFGKKPEF